MVMERPAFRSMMAPGERRFSAPREMKALKPEERKRGQLSSGEESGRERRDLRTCDEVVVGHREGDRLGNSRSKIDQLKRRDGNERKKRRRGQAYSVEPVKVSRERSYIY